MRYVYAPKRDENHKRIVGWYEAMGCGVVDTSSLGGGFPDILVHYKGLCAPVEIKAGNRKLKQKQMDFAASWLGPKVRVVRVMADVIEHVQEMVRAASARV